MNRFKCFWNGILGKLFATTHKLEEPSYSEHVARPVRSHRDDSQFSWADESVLFLGLGDDLIGLAKGLADRG